MRPVWQFLPALALTTLSQAATLTVSNDGTANYSTIQAAVQAAANGDTLLVEDGVYRGPANRGIGLAGKNITLQSRNGPEHCVIDCEHQDHAFAFHQTNTAATVLDGFTISNGRAAHGGGIYCGNRASPTIRNCILRDNAALFDGGGLYCDSYASPTIEKCLFCANVAERGGGGLRCGFGTLVLSDCTFVQNTAGQGGALRCDNMTARVTNCTFAQNAARQEGGGIYCQSNPLTLINCIFLANAVGQSGGALACWDGVTALQCTFRGNTAGAAGGGICCQSGSGTLKLLNCLFTDHTSYAIHNNWRAPVTIQGSLFYDNAPGDYYDYSGAATGVSAINHLSTRNRDNRAGLPGFVLSGDVRLAWTATSPAFDLGAGGLDMELPATDVDGNPRVLDADRNGWAVVDIGACEYNPDRPVLAVSACAVEFISEGDGVIPAPVVLEIGSGGGRPLHWQIDGNSPWLRVEPPTGTTAEKPAAVTLTAYPEGMPRGIHQAILQIRDPNAPNSPRRVPVTLRVRGKLTVPGSYPTIREALTAALPGETIEVAPGTYRENLSVVVPVHLIGIGRPVVDAPTSSSIGISVQTSGCTIEGFEIIGGGAGLTVSGSNNTIRDNLITGSRLGLELMGSANTLQDNEVAYCTDTGLSVGLTITGSTGNILRGNRLHDNSCNFRPSWLNAPDLNNDIDTSNTVDGKPVYYLIGKSDLVMGADSNAGCVVAVDCRNLRLSGLTLSHNAYGILFVNTTGSSITDCTVTQNAATGIELHNSGQNTLTGNTITDCRKGLSLTLSTGTIMRNNVLAHNACNFGVLGSHADSYWQDISTSNTVDGKPIYYLIGSQDVVLDSASNAGCVYAIRCARLTLRDLVLEHNLNGVTFVSTGDSLIENVTVADHEGTGISLDDSPGCTLRGNAVSGNYWGIFVDYDNYSLKSAAKCFLDRNAIAANTVGIYANYTDLEVTNCRVSGNLSTGFSYRGRSLRVANCTFYSNGAESDRAGDRVGLFCACSVGATITNSVFWANNSKQIAVAQAPAVVTYCNIQGGYAGEGNRDEAPLLTPDGHLCFGSPCIAAGGRDPNLPAFDIDGEPRDPAGRVDIGYDQYRDADSDHLPDWWELAYFADQTAAAPGDDPDDDGLANLEEYELYGSDPTVPAAVYYVDAGRPDDSNDGATPDSAKKTLQAAVELADNGDTIYLAPGTYPGDVTASGRPILIRSLDSTDPNVVAATVLAGTLTFKRGETRGCTLAGVTISGPTAGGLICSGASPTIRDCRIVGNSYADWIYGGGVSLVNGAAPVFRGCTISGNIGYNKGAGIFCYLSSVLLQNCIIAGNTCQGSSGPYGLALDAEQSQVTLENCTIAGHTSSGAAPALRCGRSKLRITNSILWNDLRCQVRGSESTVEVTYSDIRGGPQALEGVARTVGNITAEPCFVAPGQWQGNPSWGGGLWTDGDYHLQTTGWRWSPVLSHGSHWTWDGVTSRCIDAGNPADPLGAEDVAVPEDPGHRWGRNIRIDLGAYGGTREASVPPPGWALLTDSNNDGVVSLADFTYLGADFRSHGPHRPADASRDARIDYADLALFAECWLESTTWSR